LGFLLKGELFVAGRSKDLIIVRGKNHYPQDIEESVAFSHQALETNGCAAFSVELEQEEKLIVVQELKRTFRHRADYDSIFHTIIGEINRKHGIAPYDIVLVAPNAIPKTTSGKIQRNVCRQLWRLQQLNPLAVFRGCLFYEKSNNENE
jgi:acyl-CoA synthetase (AMP-forming)/AMP-acid ligase II